MRECIDEKFLKIPMEAPNQLELMVKVFRLF